MDADDDHHNPAFIDTDTDNETFTTDDDDDDDDFPDYNHDLDHYHEADTPLQVLFRAITDNNLDLIAQQLKAPAFNINFMPPFSFSALHHACCNSSSEALELLLTCPGANVNAQMPVNLRTPLHVACARGTPSVIQRLLEDPRIKVNQLCGLQNTPLNVACQEGNKAAVKALLADNRVAVNTPNKNGCTPFYGASQMGEVAVVELLLAHQGVDLNVRDSDGTTALWITAHQCHVSVLYAILASGRDIDVSTPSRAGNEEGWEGTTAAQIARSQYLHPFCASPSVVSRRALFGPMIANLLDYFAVDAKGARQQVRELPELRDSYIGAYFALVIFLSDGLISLKLRSSPDDTQPAVRFFTIAQALPLELQMLLCNRAFRSRKDLILIAVSEPAFKHLANPDIWTPSSSLSEHL